MKTAANPVRPCSLFVEAGSASSKPGTRSYSKLAIRLISTTGFLSGAETEMAHLEEKCLQLFRKTRKPSNEPRSSYIDRDKSQQNAPVTVRRKRNFGLQSGANLSVFVFR